MPICFNFPNKAPLHSDQLQQPIYLIRTARYYLNIISDTIINLKIQ